MNQWLLILRMFRKANSQAVELALAKSSQLQRTCCAYETLFLGLLHLSQNSFEELNIG